MNRKRISVTIRFLMVLCTAILLSLSAAGQIIKERILHNFGAGSDGLYPFSTMIWDAQGNLYGTTWEGGTGPCNGGCGIVYELTPGDSDQWTETVLYNFQGRPSDAGKSSASLVFDASGNLFGTTRYGGLTTCPKACGTVFELSPNGDGTWSETIIYEFTGGKDGENPYAELIFDKAGNLFGNTYGGGRHHKGTVFKLTPWNGTWTESVIYNFGGKDGNGPLAGLIMDASGNLYGTTGRGGSANKGVVFELTPANGGPWKYSVLYSFTGSPSDGAEPSADLILDSAGNLYSTTRNGGSGGCKNGCGAVFELSPSGGGTWTETLIYSFTGKPDGSSLFGGLLMDKDGNLYGATDAGGTKGDGIVYKLTHYNGTWTETVLHTFQGFPKDGARSYANLIFDSHGNLYGTTIFGGANDPGVVFQLLP